MPAPPPVGHEKWLAVRCDQLLAGAALELAVLELPLSLLPVDDVDEEASPPDSPARLRLLPALKSVSYQPPPLSRNAGAESSLRNSAAAQP